MAVKQNVVECVEGPVSKQASLSLILRLLSQNLADRTLPPEKVCPQLVASLGSIQIPNDIEKYKQFMHDIKCVQNMLAKECANQELVYQTLKALYTEISNPNKTLSAALSIVLQLLNPEMIPEAVKYILNTGYSESNLERALWTLCNWLTKWILTDNLGPLVLAFMRGLEAEHHYDILVEVTKDRIEQLFPLLVLEGSRPSVGPVVLYMLSRMQDSPVVFHKIIPQVNVVVSQLDKEKSETSHFYLQHVVNLCVALMEHFPGYPELYEPLKKVLEPYYPGSNYKEILNCSGWVDGSGLMIPSRCSIGKVGLNNLGNTCYMNSILQSLFMTKTFRNEVLLHSKEMMPLFSKLQVLFALLQHSKRYSLSPSDILNLSRPPGFQPGHQHDSSEFLGYLLDTLHEQEKSSASGLQAIGDSGVSSSASTIVQESFGGKTVTISRCGVCGRQSERPDNFRELQLSFPSTSDNQSVQTLLDYYLQPEKLSGDNQYHCEMCEKLTDGERITRIMEPPARLILTLKHFRYDPTSHQRTKLLQTVKLDNNIRLENVDYELYAAVVHCGSSVDSGHYYTFAKDDNNWFKFNDCSVLPATAEDLCKLKPPETPYILFYCRQDVMDPETLPHEVLSSRLQNVLTNDQLEFESERRRPIKVTNWRQKRNDDPPPPGCGGDRKSVV